jgi:hypothetical protein
MPGLTFEPARIYPPLCCNAHVRLPVYRNAVAAFLPVYRNAVAAFLRVYRNALRRSCRKR